MAKKLRDMHLMDIVIARKDILSIITIDNLFRSDALREYLLIAYKNSYDRKDNSNLLKILNLFRGTEYLQAIIDYIEYNLNVTVTYVDKKTSYKIARRVDSFKNKNFLSFSHFVKNFKLQLPEKKPRTAVRKPSRKPTSNKKKRIESRKSQDIYDNSKRLPGSYGSRQ